MSSSSIVGEAKLVKQGVRGVIRGLTMDNNILEKIREAKDVNLYQQLLRTLGDYSASVPATGVDNLFDTAAAQGKKILPKDKKALEILDYILSSGITARVVHKLLNLRFSDLPVECRPIMKDGRKHLVANWSRGAKISDRVKDLVNWEADGKAGRWTDIDGEATSLIPIQKEKQNDK